MRRLEWMERKCGNCVFWVYYFTTKRVVPPKYTVETVKLGKCGRTGDWRSSEGLPCESHRFPSEYREEREKETKEKIEIIKRTLQAVGIKPTNEIIEKVNE